MHHIRHPTSINHSRNSLSHTFSKQSLTNPQQLNLFSLVYFLLTLNHQTVFLVSFSLCFFIIILSPHILSFWCTVTFLYWFFLTAVLLSNLHARFYFICMASLIFLFLSLQSQGFNRKLPASGMVPFFLMVGRKQTRKMNIQVIKQTS